MDVTRSLRVAEKHVLGGDLSLNNFTVPSPVLLPSLPQAWDPFVGRRANKQPNMNIDKEYRSGDR